MTRQRLRAAALQAIAPRIRALAPVALALAAACAEPTTTYVVQVEPDGAAREPDTGTVRPPDAHLLADTGSTPPQDAWQPPPPPEPDRWLSPPEPDAALPADAAGPTPDAGPGPACPEPPLGEPAPWRHDIASPLVVGLGTPQHSAVEPIVNPDAEISVAGKFAYGVISKDLQDEDVALYLQREPCGEWTPVGVGTTDSDGRTAVDVDPALLSGPGSYDFRMVVLGDQTFARGAIWVVEPGTDLVLFDVDGTLTVGDSEIFEEVLLGSEPEMYEAADVVTNTYFDAGYQPLYMTGRPYFLNGVTRQWLETKGFPKGPVRTTDSVTETLPTAGGVQTYKRAYLEWVLDSTGVNIPYAYGNASTDICAYALAGLDPATTYIIGPHAGEACEGFAPTQPVESYPAHLPALQNLPRAQ